MDGCFYNVFTLQLDYHSLTHSHIMESNWIKEPREEPTVNNLTHSLTHGGTTDRAATGDKEAGNYSSPSVTSIVGLREIQTV